MAAPRAFPGPAHWQTAACEPLTGDASARKYFRLRAEAQTAILMDASQVPDSVAPFVRIAKHLRQLGFSAPEILARDAENGLLLLEDFGDDSFARLLENRSCDALSRVEPEFQNRKGSVPAPGAVFRALAENPDASKSSKRSCQLRAQTAGCEAPPATPEAGVLPGFGIRVESLPVKTGDEASPILSATGASQLPEKLFTLATDVLIALHRHPQAVPENLREYHPEKMLEDIELFVQWRTPDVTALEKEDFRAAWRAVLPLAHQVPASLLLRDYHVANLMLLSNRDGVRQAGLLDFQDAYRGPVTYDLISLLEDARRDVPEDLQQKLLARYLAAFPALDREMFETSLAILAAQRHTRVLGIFERLARHEGKLDYRRLHSPRVERRLRHALHHPILTDVKTWMERHARTD